MIAKLTGKITRANDESLIIDVNGVGYLVFCSAKTLEVVSKNEEVTSLLVETHVREDHIHLFGFFEEAEQNCFKILTTVQGVGAKVALGILSSWSPDKLANAISAGDKNLITKAPGVGPKLAARIITELKDKMGSVYESQIITNYGQKSVNKKVDEGVISDVISALENLGYQRGNAYAASLAAADRLGDSVSLQVLIREALSELSAGKLQ
jgi:Holliday junction DNA helicase RuvA|tara:strand:- start:1173 stop:1802 length:630 start_codon:yes stop_codon:yes gene_type:complete